MKKRILSFALLILILSSLAVPVAADNNSATVFITDFGSKYHRATCKYLDNSSHAVTLAAAVSLGKTPCSVCKPPVLSTPTSSDYVGVRSTKNSSGSPAFAIVVVSVLGYIFLRSLSRKKQSSKQTPPPQKADSAKPKQIPTQRETATRHEPKASTNNQKSSSSTPKPITSAQAPERRTYQIGDIYYCWDYYYAKVFSARISEITEKGAVVDFNGVKKSVSYADLERRFYPNPEDVPEYRSIKRSYPYQSTAAQESAKKNGEDHPTAQNATRTTQQPQIEKPLVDNLEHKAKENHPVQATSFDGEKTCNNCRLRKGGQCSQVRNILCEDYIALPDEIPSKTEHRKETRSVQFEKTTPQEHSVADVRLSDIKDSVVWVDIPGGGYGVIVNAEPIIIKDRQDIRIDVLFDNGTEKSLALSICSRNRWFEILSGKVKKKDILSYFERQAVEQELKKNDSTDPEVSERERIPSLVKERKEAYRYLTEERGVEYFLHYTPIRNLQSIINNGLIPREMVMRQNINAVMPDERRIDGRPDCTSLSISFPNYQLLFRNRSSNYSFAILLIDPSIRFELYENEVYYLPHNAAKIQPERSTRYTGMDSLRALFSNQVMTNQGMKTRRELGIPYNYPSNPQAEVFISGRIPPSYIKHIVVENYKTLTELRATLKIPSDRDNSFLSYDAKLFSYRCDWESWKKDAAKDS